MALSYDYLIEETKAYIKATNPSKAPYHSNEHMLKVCVLADEIYQQETQIKRLELRGTYDLQLAALFHDYGHSGGAQSDATNIAVAIAAMREYALGQFSDAAIERAEAIIRCTEYSNGGFPVEPTNLLQECMRDADVLYAAIVGSPQVILEDLRSEMEVVFDRSISLREMLEGQVAFNQKVRFYTQTGYALWVRNREKLYRAMERYVDQLEQGIPRCGQHCPCKNLHPIQAQDIRVITWHYAVVEYQSRGQRSSTNGIWDAGYIERASPHHRPTHDLGWLEYLKAVGEYLGPNRTAAWPKTWERLNQDLAAAKAEVAAMHEFSKGRLSFFKPDSSASCPLQMNNLKDRIQFLYRQTTL